MRNKIKQNKSEIKKQNVTINGTCGCRNKCFEYN